jgi:hypothetical protein
MNAHVWEWVHVKKTALKCCSPLHGGLRRQEPIFRPHFPAENSVEIFTLKM